MMTMIRMMIRMVTRFPIPGKAVLHNPSSLQYLDVSLELCCSLFPLFITPRERVVYYVLIIVEVPCQKYYQIEFLPT